MCALLGRLMKNKILDFVRKLFNNKGEDNMITHHMMEKRVSWNILEKVKLGKTVHYIRKMRFGVVKDVSQCGNLCLVVDDIGNRYEIETPELDTLD
jgi:hypothetical protein